jgi:DNA adenine methylase
MLKSPLRYIGSKTRALKYIMPLIPNNINTYREPFMGSLCVGLNVYKEKKPSFCVFSDFEEQLVNFFNQIRSEKTNEHVVHICREWLENLTREELKLFFYRVKEAIVSEHYKPYHAQRAAMYYLINRCSFSGTGMFGGFNGGDRFTKAGIDELLNFKNVFDPDNSPAIFCQDYYRNISMFPNRRDFIFCDPPYCQSEGFKTPTLYKDHKNFDHKLLAERLNKIDSRVLITYNDCREIRELYKDWKFEEYQISYGSSQNEGKELLLRNY